MTYFSISCSLRPARDSPLSAASGSRLRTASARSAWDRTTLPSTGWPPSLRRTPWTTAIVIEVSLKDPAICRRYTRQLAEKQGSIGTRPVARRSASSTVGGNGGLRFPVNERVLCCQHQSLSSLVRHFVASAPI